MPTQQQQLAFPFEATPGELPPEFARLREGEPVTRVVLPTGDHAWLVTRYADVRTVLADNRFSRAAAEAPGAPRMGKTSPGPRTILGMDPPEHTRLRRLVSQAFTARRIEELRPRTEQIANELMHAINVAPRPVDLMATYALVLPVKVIFEVLGVPYEDCDRLHAWTDVIFSLGGYSEEEIADARGRLREYFVDMVAARRREPTDDLLGVLVSARDEGQRLSEGELIEFALILLTVGHMSTANTLVGALYTLLRHPQELARLHSSPDLVPTAVEELVRYNPFALTGTQMRVAAADVEVGGVTIPAGDGVIATVASANHDAEVFDRPDELDLGRADNPHLAFGYGVHVCLGAQLARMELQVALSTLIRRLPPTLRLAVPEDWLNWKVGLTARSLVSLPVDW